MTAVSIIPQDVVVVTTNYRLDLFGFYAADLLRTRGGDNSTGNYGIQATRHPP